jgi:hypothetical protein
MTDADDQLLRQRAAALRILTLAIIVGAIMITGVFIVIQYVALEGKPLVELGPVPVLSLIALAVAVVGLAGSIFMPARVRRTTAEQWAAGIPPAAGPGESAVSRLTSAYASSHILGLALAEGPALLGVVFFLLEGHWLALLPLGLGILVMIWKFPSEAGLRDWVEARLAEAPERPSKPVVP